MESRNEAPESTQGTRLGSFDVTLLLDPGTSAHASRTTVRTSERVAPDVTLVIGSLLFAERQMRAISDPARIAAANEIAQATSIARGLANPPTTAPPARESATFHIDVYANGNFRINVEQRLDGLLRDVAGGLTASSLVAELLQTLNGPYREFYREMLEAANDYWRDRRPSSIESTWNWQIALRRMNQLVGQSTPVSRESVRCESCDAVRPAGSPCLRCGSLGSVVRPALEAPVTYQPVVAPPIVPPVVPEPPPVVAQPPAASRVMPPPAVPARSEPEHTILPARDLVVEAAEVELDPRLSWPLATLPRRLGSLALDLVSGIALGMIGGGGLTGILVASGQLGPGDNPGAFLTAAALVIFGLYLWLGWIKGETLGMLVFRLKIVRAADRAPAGVFGSLRRAFGTFLLVAVAVGVFAGLVALDNSLDFIQGLADAAMRVIAALLALYIVWIGSFQPIISRANRQTWGDRMARTIVVVQQKS